MTIYYKTIPETYHKFVAFGHGIVTCAAHMHQYNGNKLVVEFGTKL